MDWPSVFTLSTNARLGDPDSLVLQGSKSYTNRALIMAALSKKPVILTNASESDDSKALCAALACFGVQFEVSADRITVVPPRSGFTPYSGTIDVGAAGTTMRFLCAFSAFVPGCEIILQGSKRMHERPISVLVHALRTLGADVEYLEHPDCPPLRIKGTTPIASTVSLGGSVSSQYFSALLLLAPFFHTGLTIQVQGHQISRSYIDMTLSAMESSGISVENKNYREYIIPVNSHYTAKTLHIEGDASGASYFWALAALAKKEITIENINKQSLQGDVGFVDILAKMGCISTFTDNSITVRGSSSRLQAVTVDMESMPDTAQTLAVLAACASGTTHITGLQTLRIKETDRISALQCELKKCGIHTTATADSISIQGGIPQPAAIATYHDHRMAMSFAILGAITTGMQIQDPQVVTKSFPDFWTELEKMGVSSQ